MLSQASENIHHHNLPSPHKHHKRRIVVDISDKSISLKQGRRSLSPTRIHTPMTKHSGSDEESSAVYKRPTKASLDDSSECRQYAGSSLSALPIIPGNLIAQLILPFVGDRTTWNNLCMANKELHEANHKWIPPWPEKGSIQVGSRVTCVALSPNGTHVAWGSHDRFLHMWDATGPHTCLDGHSNRITHLFYSQDGRNLVSASRDNSVRPWDTSTFADYAEPTPLFAQEQAHPPLCCYRYTIEAS